MINKKVISLVLSTAIAFSTFTPAFAAENISPEASAVAALNILKGDSAAGVDAVYLAKNSTRLQTAVMYLRIKGLEQEALNFNAAGQPTFADAKQVDWAGGRNILAYLKANPELGWIGSNGNFNPNGKIKVEDYYKVMLTALGFQQGVDFEWADVMTFAAAKGLDDLAGDTSFSNDDLAKATVEALKASMKSGGKTLATQLVEAGILNATAAANLGLYVAPVVAVDLKSAVTVNSKVVIVSLATATSTIDAKAITVKDNNGNAVAVSSVSMAGWDTTNKTAIVKLTNDTTVGTLYTVISGNKTVNFGGKAADTTKATVTDVQSADYNQVKVTFSEAVELDGATFVLAEKYGTKAALAVSNIAYGDTNNVIVLTTADQKAATLYGIEITGVKDFAGNVIDKDADRTFVGTAKSTAKLELTNHKVVDYKTVLLGFNKKVDPATVKAAAIAVQEVYGTKATVAVASVAMATADDVVGFGVAKENTIVVTLGGELKESTLYKATVTGMATIYGVAIDTDKDETTFVGTAKPATELAMPGISVVSNTQIKLTFDRKLDKATAETAANYVMAEVYGAKAALAVTKAELDTTGKIVTLTVGSMKNALYSIAITNVKDIYANTLKTTSDANKTTLVGTAVAEKITKINSISRFDATTIDLVFDKNVGATATDVSHYVIDNNVGYPEKAEILTPNTVRLTIPKTEAGKIFTITVKGLENADNVAMAAEGVKATFVGQGITATLPTLDAAIAVDAQTLKVYFNRDVKDKTIDTKVWNSTTNTLVANKLFVANDGTTFNALDAFAGAYVYQDPTNANVLIVKTSTAAAFNSTTATTSDDTFRIKADQTVVKATNNADTVLVFAYNNTAATKITVDNVMATSKNSIRVYFNQPVEIGADFAKIAMTTAVRDKLAVATTAGVDNDFTDAVGALTLSNATAVDSTNMVYDFLVSADLAAGSNYLVINPEATIANIHDYTINGNAGFVTVKDETTSSAATIEQVREFAGSATAAGVIKEVPVMMTDKRTIQVYFPEIMNASDVTDATNYAIKSGTGAALIDMATEVAEIVYDAKTNIATITLNQDVDATINGYFVEFANDIRNAVGNKVVEKTTTAHEVVKTEFAPSTVEAKKVQVVSATFSGGNLVVKLNQKINNVGAYDDTAFLADFKVTAVKADGTTITLAGADITSASAANGTSGATITVVVATALKAEQVGKVEFVTAPTITGFNGLGFDKDSSVIFAQ